MININNKFRKFIKNTPFLNKICYFFWNFFFDKSQGKTSLNILHTFPIFMPYSSGNYKDRASLTIQSINQIFPNLHALVSLTGSTSLKIINISFFQQSEIQKKSAQVLKSAFDKYGSDKSNYHNYHYLYGSILSDNANIENIFEVGLGSNNTDVVSNMGVYGKPGASLRSFQEFCPNANIFGGDIDKRVLFSEDRIKTFYVDQTKSSTFDEILPFIPNNFDLVIDDGLHSPDANVATLEFGLKIIKKGGWVVIEDIDEDAIVLWQVVSTLLPSDQYNKFLIKAEGAIVFAVQKIK
jgi:hypothetical protein